MKVVEYYSKPSSRSACSKSMRSSRKRLRRTSGLKLDFSFKRTLSKSPWTVWKSRSSSFGKDATRERVLRKEVTAIYRIACKPECVLLPDTSGVPSGSYKCRRRNFSLANRMCLVTPEERERMIFLCKRIKAEKSPEKFNELVELNDILNSKQERLRKTKPNWWLPMIASECSNSVEGSRESQTRSV